MRIAGVEFFYYRKLYRNLSKALSQRLITEFVPLKVLKQPLVLFSRYSKKYSMS